jgi:hypothetical protein
MLTYRTLEGNILDLTTLAPGELEYFQRCFAAYRDGMRWRAFLDDLVNSDDNPAIEPGRRITLQTLDSVLYRAIRDLGDRLGIAQGKLGPSAGDDLDSQPLEDTALPVPDAAEQAGVSVRAVYGAIDRGDLIATRTRPVRVSQRSLEHWRVNATRQRAGKARAR